MDPSPHSLHDRLPIRKSACAYVKCQSMVSSPTELKGSEVLQKDPVLFSLAWPIPIWRTRNHWDYQTGHLLTHHNRQAGSGTSRETMLRGDHAGIPHQVV